MTLQDEIRRRRELGMPPLTAEEQRQFQQNLTDTAGRDLREAGRGTVKSTMKGTKVLDGPYKGLTRPQMEQAIITGAAPPGKYAPGRMGTVRGSITGDSMYSPQAPSIAPPAPSAAPAPAAQTPPSAPSAAPAPVSAAQSLLTIPPLGAKPPLAPAPAPAPTAAPRAPGMINGQSAPQFFQEAANRQGIANSYGTIKPQITPTPTRPVDPVLTEPRGFGAAPRPIAPALTDPRGFGAGPVAKPTAGVTPPAQDKLTPLIQSTQAMITQARTPATMPPSPTATRNGPPLVGLSAPKWQPATPVDGSGIADTMKNNQMIRPGFDKIIAAQKFPVPTAAMPKPASSSPTSRPAKTLQPPQLVMAR